MSELETPVRPSRHYVGAFALFAVLGYWMQYFGAWRWNSVYTDSAIFRLAGKAVLAGDPIYEFRYLEGYGWTYPPFGALIMVPLAPFSLPVARYGSLLIAFAALVWAVRLAFARLIAEARTTEQRRLITTGLVLAAIPLAPIAQALSLGQIGIYLMLAVLIDFRGIESGRGKYWGVLTGIAAAVKLLPGIFMLYWLLKRQWRPFFMSSASFVACWIIGALVLPNDTLTYFTNGYYFRTADRMGGKADSYRNQSLRAMFDRLLDPSIAVKLWFVVAVMVLVGGLWLAMRLNRLGDPMAVIAVLGMTSVFISPVSWVHHAVWVVPALAALVGFARDRRTVRWAFICAVPLMMAPPLMEQAPFTDYFVFWYAVLAFGLALLMRADDGGRGVADSREGDHDRS